MLEIFAMIFIAIAPGYLVSTFFKKLDSVERLAVSFFITFLMIGGIGLVLNSFSIPLKYSLLPLVFLPLLFLYKRPSFKISIPKMLLLILIIAFVLRLLFQFAFDFSFGYDGFLHMVLAKTFTTSNWFFADVSTIGADCVNLPCPVEDRPPFYNFVVGFFFDLFGSSYEVGKYVNVITGTLLVVPIYLIGRKFGNVGYLAALFIAVSPFFIGQAVDTEVRTITALTALTSFYFFTKKGFSWSFVILAITFLIHYPEAIVLGLVYTAYFIKNKASGLFTQKNLIAVVIAILILSPWLIRNYDTYGNPLFSSSDRFVKFNSEYEGMALSEDYVSHDRSLQERLYDRGFMLLRSILPAPYSNGQFNLNFLSNENLINRSIVSFITLPLAILALIYLAKSAVRLRGDFDLIFIYVVFGFIFALAVSNIIIPIELSLLFPQVALLTVAGFAVFQKLKHKVKKIFSVLIIAFLVVQVGNFTLKSDVRTDYGQDWIMNNTDPDDTIMVRWTNTYLENYLTGRNFVAIRYGTNQEFLDYVRDNGIDYIIVDSTDLFVGGMLDRRFGTGVYNIDLDFLRKNFEEAAVLEVSEKNLFRSYRDTYYVYKVV